MAPAAPRDHARGRAGARLHSLAEPMHRGTTLGAKPGLSLALSLTLGLALSLGMVTAAPAQGAADKAGTLTVGSGDTATALAQKLRPEAATLEQTLVALWRANPRAFANGNLNLLLQGATLQLPSEAEILRLPAPQARALVLEQVENFQAFARQQGASASAASAPTSSVKPGAPDAAAWARALAEAQALKDALERQSRETQARLAQLEKNIQTLQGLQASSGPTAATAAAAAAAAPAQPAASSEPTLQAAPGAAAMASASDPVASTDASSAPPAASASPAPASGPAHLDRPTLLWGAAAAVLALMLLWTWLHQRGRDRAQAQAPTRAREPGQVAQPATVDATPTATPATAPATAPAATSADLGTGIPPLLASIDLNLGGPGTPTPEDRRP